MRSIGVWASGGGEGEQRHHGLAAASLNEVVDRACTTVCRENESTAVELQNLVDGYTDDFNIYPRRSLR